MARETAARTKPQRAQQRKSAGQTVTDAQLLKMARQFGALGAKVISPSTVETGTWVRWKCQFGCDGYASSLMCPPHSPAPVETRRMLGEYRQAVLFEAPPGQSKQIAVQLERALFLEGCYKAFGLGAGPCNLCESCAFDEGCRHAEQARPSMEACGIDVFATARKHGFTINVVRHYKEPQHYFGLVLVR